jgi:hypothetical protein
MAKHNGHLMPEDGMEPDWAESFELEGETPEEAAEFYRRHSLMVSDDSDEGDIRRQAFREAAIDWKKFSDRQDMILGKLGILQIDCLLLARGNVMQLGLVGVKNPQVELARRHGVTKADVSKYVNQYQRQLGLTALAARKDTSKMRQRRKEQLV